MNIFRRIYRYIIVQSALKRAYKIEEWKYNNCFNEERPLCNECCSGGGLTGALCNEMMKKWKSERKHRNKTGAFYFRQGQSKAKRG